MTTEINLLPWRDELRFKKMRFFKMQLFVFLGMAILILLLWHLILKRKIEVVIKQANYLERQLSFVNGQIQNSNRIKKQQENIQQTRSQVIKLEQRRLRFKRIFKLIHDGVTANLYLTGLQIKNNEVKITGKTKSISDLGQLVTSLTQDKDGSTVAVQKISREDDIYDFELLWLCLV